MDVVLNVCKADCMRNFKLSTFGFNVAQDALNVRRILNLRFLDNLLDIGMGFTSIFEKDIPWR